MERYTTQSPEWANNDLPALANGLWGSAGPSRAVTVVPLFEKLSPHAEAEALLRLLQFVPAGDGLDFEAGKSGTRGKPRVIKVERWVGLSRAETSAEVGERKIINGGKKPFLDVAFIHESGRVLFTHIAGGGQKNSDVDEWIRDIAMATSRGAEGSEFDRDAGERAAASRDWWSRLRSAVDFKKSKGAKGAKGDPEAKMDGLTDGAEAEGAEAGK